MVEKTATRWPWRDILGVDTFLIDEGYRAFLQSRRDHSRWEVARLAWSADFNDASNFLDTLRALGQQ